MYRITLLSAQECYRYRKNPNSKNDILSVYFVIPYRQPVAIKYLSNNNMFW